jgi:sialidase-1
MVAWKCKSDGGMGSKFTCFITLHFYWLAEPTRKEILGLSGFKMLNISSEVRPLCRFNNFQNEPMRPSRFSIPVFLLASACAWGESFETFPVGSFTDLETGIGSWSAQDHSARIHEGRGKSGKQSLRIVGEGERAVVLKLANLAEKGTLLAFQAERWTKRDPFEFRIDVKGAGTWKEIYKGDDEVRVGGFLTEVRIQLPEGTREVRFRSTSPEDAGILIDDVQVHRAGPALATSVEVVQAVCPAFIRQDFNPILGFRVTVEGSEGEVFLEGIELGFGGTTHMEDIESFKIFTGQADPSADAGEVIAKGNRVSDRISLPLKHGLAAGEHWFWVSPVLKKSASIDGRVDASVFRVKAGGKVLVPAQPSPEGSQRIGYAVRLPGDDDSKSYRIPGLVRTHAGTLLAVYDIRYRHAGDLPADIDVGVSRSADGGQSWERMIVAMDMGNDPKHSFDGVGDPAILVDPKSGRIWIAALWSHGNRGWNGSGPGMTPEETGQFMLAHSDDDGKTWSKPINITPQVKDPAWRLCFNGPGAGIALDDGTLVFPAQYRAADGKPWSTIISSKDQGESWQIGDGVKSDTTEAQVVQLADGRIMINCRDNRGGSRTVAVSRDLGKSWEFHATDRSALQEPVCMASLLRWKHPQHGDLMLFSNPNTKNGRYNMSLKLSRDQAMTWPDSAARLYDSRSCFGYSCLAPASADHVGVLYEGKSSMLYLRLPLDEWFK